LCWSASGIEETLPWGCGSWLVMRRVLPWLCRWENRLRSNGSTKVIQLESDLAQIYLSQTFLWYLLCNHYFSPNLQRRNFWGDVLAHLSFFPSPVPISALYTVQLNNTHIDDPSFRLSEDLRTICWSSHCPHLWLSYHYL
jgi:hypothetical protein